MLLCDNVRLSNRQMVLCDNAPTPGNFKLASALPTSACVTPSLGRREKGQKRSIFGKWAKINPRRKFQRWFGCRRMATWRAGLSFWRRVYRDRSLPNFIRRCLNLSANASNSLGSVSVSGWRPAAATAAAIAGWCEPGWPWCPGIRSSGGGGGDRSCSLVEEWNGGGFACKYFVE